MSAQGYLGSNSSKQIDWAECTVLSAWYQLYEAPIQVDRYWVEQGQSEAATLHALKHCDYNSGSKYRGPVPNRATNSMCGKMSWQQFYQYVYQAVHERN